MIVTVARTGRGRDAMRSRYRITLSPLPGKTFGPYTFGEAKSQIEFSCDLPMPVARGLILDAYLSGVVSLDTGTPR